MVATLLFAFFWKKYIPPPAHIKEAVVFVVVDFEKMPATNAHLHDKSIYYKDGIFCDPPKKVSANATTSEAPSKGYHWEERDLLPFALKELKGLLDGAELWRKGDDRLVVTKVDLRGDCASSLRKGKRILTYALVATVTLSGARGDAGLEAILTTEEFAHDDTTDLDLTTDTTRLPYEGKDPDRALKTYELFDNILRRKAKPQVLNAIQDLKQKLQHRGG